MKFQNRGSKTKVGGVSMVIPVLNEEEIIVNNIKKLTDYMESLKVPYEIIIGSNGSTDKTDFLARGLLKKYKRLVFFSLAEKGIGSVFKKAAKISRYDYLVSFDIDLSSDMSFIGNSLGLLEDYSIVVGAKTLGEQSRPLFRKTISAACFLLTKIFLNLQYHDYGACAKAYKKSAIKKYFERIVNDSSYVQILLFFAAKDKLKICEVPVNCVDHRKSRFSLFSESVLTAKTLLRLYMENLMKV